MPILFLVLEVKQKSQLAAQRRDKSWWCERFVSTADRRILSLCLGYQHAAEAILSSIVLMALMF